MPELPDHLVELPGTGFCLWKWVCVRSAGFPGEDALRLAAAQAPALADRVLEAEAEESRAVEAVGLLVGGRRAEWPKRIRRLEKGGDPGGGPDMGRALEALRGARAARAERARELEAAFDADLVAIRRRLKATAGESSFREAVTWQNRRALETGIDALIRTDDRARDQRARMHELLVASYVQRYAVKNDSIGFFGPVTWATVVPAGPALAMRHGPALVGARDVYVDQWCVDALAQALPGEDLLRWLPPRLAPHVRCERDAAFLSTGERLELQPELARVLAACDGERTPAEIASALAGLSEADVLAWLEAARDQDLVRWTLELPLDVRPEAALRARLERVGDPGLRAMVLAPLAELEAARDRVARAGGEATRVGAAVADFEATFVRLTGTEATRRAGEVYGGRSLIYEDCRRDAAIEIGPSLVARLARPLGLVLEAARWRNREIYARLERRIANLHERLARETGRDAVELGALQDAAMQEGGFERCIEEVDAAHRERWGRVLAPPAAGTRVHRLDGRELGGRVREAFRSDDGTPALPRELDCTTPDIMIAARSVEEVAAGRGLLVMGEAHPVNTVLCPALLLRHPDPGSVLRAVATDAGGRRVLLAASDGAANRPLRVKDDFLPGPTDLVYELSSRPGHLPRDRVLRAAEFVVERTAAGLRARTRDGEIALDPIVPLQRTLQQVLAVEWLDPRPYMPRIVIDDLVLLRETWRFDANELAFARAGSELELFLAARRWARAHGIPRFAFVKAPSAVEAKPYFLDLDSPPLVALFAKVVRRTQTNTGATTITVSEMLPAPDETWLRDAEGRSYTSELRTVCVGREPDRAPEPRRAHAALGTDANDRLRRSLGPLTPLPLAPLGSWPTPVERLPGLSRRLGCEVWVKRDDACSPIYGGNKTRKLELVLGKALASGSKSIVTVGGVGSNQVVGAALHARALGLVAYGLVFAHPTTPKMRARLRAAAALGLRLVPFDGPRDFERAVARVTALAPAPHHFIPAGSSTPEGNLAFVAAGLELGDQVARGLLPAPDEIYVPLGTGGTAAGLLLGCALAGLATTVVGVRVAPDRDAQSVPQAVESMRALLARRGARLGVLADQPLEVVEDQAGAFYGAPPTPAVLDAVTIARESDGLDLEPGYAGRAMAALIARARSGRSVLFWNTQSSRPMPPFAGAPPRLPDAIEAWLGEV